MKKSYIFSIIVISALIVGYIITRASPKEEIVIGVIAPFSGPVAAFGEEIKRGIEEVVPKGVTVIYEDEACDPKTAIAAFKKLTELDHATIIIGPACGAPQKAIAPLVPTSGAIVITPTAAPEELYTLSKGKMFTTQYSLEDESAFNAKKVSELGYKRVAVITYKNAFSEVHYKTFIKEFTGEIVETISLDEMSTTLDTDLLRLSKKNIDAIYVTDISFFFAGGMQKLEKNKITAPVFSTYVVEIPMARPLVSGVYYSFPKDIPGDDGGTYLLAKDAARMLLPLALTCNGRSSCVLEKLLQSGNFRTNGVQHRDIILKQIKSER